MLKKMTICSDFISCLILTSVQGHEESVEDFVRRNLGDEVFERLIEPFCSGACIMFSAV